MKSLQPLPNKSGVWVFAALNAAFVVAIVAGAAVSGAQNPRLLYLALLFALCSSSIIDLDGWNGRNALLAMFMVIYFVFFGVGGVAALMRGAAAPPEASPLSATEAVVLVGGLLLVLSYRAAVAMLGGRGRAPLRRRGGREWPIGTIVGAGAALWVVGTFATYYWYFHVVTDVTNAATRKGLASHSELVISGLILAQLVQPLGILLTAYAWRTRRSAVLVALLAVMVALQVVLGFVIDIKGTALLGGVLVIVTIVLIDGRLPVWWIAGAALFVQLSFPVFQAYRVVVHGDLGLARTTVLDHLGKALHLALSAEQRVEHGPDRAQTFFERLSLMGSVQMIVERTGVDVPYQRGHTLTPLISTFVPRLLWAGKPDVQAGQLVNQAFHVSDSADTYISPSHLGELYWNFGWAGVVLGMPIIGLLCGWVGARFNLRDGVTVTRLLVTILTLQYIIHGFEGSIAVSYVVWLRSLAAVAALDRLFARPAGRDAPGPVTAAPMPQRRFPNLLA